MAIGEAVSKIDVSNCNIMIDILSLDLLYASYLSPRGGKTLVVPLNEDGEIDSLLRVFRAGSVRGSLMV